jgi:DNA-binding XRE family transcriptional regulator
MTIQDKEWLSHQTIRLSLSGHTQEQIARELHVSEGTVNAIIQELINSDDTLVLQREIAIVSKSSGISIKQIASNMAFANAIKAMAYENDRHESVIRAIDSICIRDGSFNPDAIATIFMQFCEMVLKNNTSPINVYRDIQSKYREFDNANKQLEDMKIKLKQLKVDLDLEYEKHRITGLILQKFLSLKKDFEEVGLNFDKRDEILNFLRNLKQMHTNPKKIINEVKRVSSLKVHKLSLIEKCEKIEKILENYKKEIELQKRSTGFLYPAVELVTNLLQRGNSPESILKLFEILSKHPDLSLVQFAYDIETYGGIKAALDKKFLDFMRMDSTTQDLPGYGTVTNQNQQVQ